MILFTVDTKKPIRCKVCGSVLLYDSNDYAFKSKTLLGHDLVVFMEKPSITNVYMKCANCGSDGFILFKKKKITS